MATVADELMIALLPDETRAMLKRLCEDGAIFDLLDVDVHDVDGMCPVCERGDLDLLADMEAEDKRWKPTSLDGVTRWTR